MGLGPLYVVTFVTRSRRCCYYAATATVQTSGDLAPPRLPVQVQAQLDALGARVAWMYIGPPSDLRIQGEAFSECDPVTTAGPDQIGRLVMC